MRFIHKIIFLLFVFSALLLMTACNKKDRSHSIRVGTIAGPETQLMSTAKEVAEKRYGLKIEIITFNDYTMPNIALSEGSLDANVFQHQAYLDESIAEHHFHLSAIGKTFIYPMAIYSKKINKLAVIHSEAVVTIPNDPSNETRALLLLQDAHLIKLRTMTKPNLSLQDIASNPLHLKIKELDAALLTRTLEDAELSVINANYAVLIGLLPDKNGLFSEPATSPYANLIVVRSEEANRPVFKQLEEVLHSKEVQNAAKEIFQGTAIPAWNTGSKRKILQSIRH
jgi:D-methionine transport system substrate-binding protein